MSGDHRHACQRQGEGQDLMRFIFRHCAHRQRDGEEDLHLHDNEAKPGEIRPFMAMNSAPNWNVPMQKP